MQNSLVRARNVYVVARRQTHRASKELDSIIRVDHAGELGADRIYAGQMAVLGKLNIILKKIIYQIKLKLFIAN